MLYPFAFFVCFFFLFLTLSFPSSCSNSSALQWIPLLVALHRGRLMFSFCFILILFFFYFFLLFFFFFFFVCSFCPCTYYLPTRFALLLLLLACDLLWWICLLSFSFFPWAMTSWVLPCIGFCCWHCRSSVSVFHSVRVGGEVASFTLTAPPIP